MKEPLYTSGGPASLPLLEVKNFTINFGPQHPAAV
jgi:hypothetical protein